MPVGGISPSASRLLSRTCSMIARRPKTSMRRPLQLFPVGYQKFSPALPRSYVMSGSETHTLQDSIRSAASSWIAGQETSSGGGRTLDVVQEGVEFGLRSVNVAVSNVPSTSTPLTHNTRDQYGLQSMLSHRICTTQPNHLGTNTGSL